MGVIAHEILHVVNRHHLAVRTDAGTLECRRRSLINRLLEDDKYVTPDGLFDQDGVRRAGYRDDLRA